MTDQQHPLTPPPELVEQWYRASEHANEKALQDVATQAARWGSDQELEACCAWTAIVGGAEALRNHRRPKPPSLKQQALEALQRAEEGWRPIPDDCNIIRRALEQLDD